LFDLLLLPLFEKLTLQVRQFEFEAHILVLELLYFLFQSRMPLAEGLSSLLAAINSRERIGLVL